MQALVLQDAADGNGDAERVGREALSLVQSRLVPVVAAPQKERPRAKLTGPPSAVLPAAFRKSPPPGERPCVQL